MRGLVPAPPLVTRVALGPGTLKCVIAGADCDGVEAALHHRIGADDVLRIQDGTFVIYTDAEPSAIRDWLLPIVGPSALLVVEFERWSGAGTIDRDWLNRRGH